MTETNNPVETLESQTNVSLFASGGEILAASEQMKEQLNPELGDNNMLNTLVDSDCEIESSIYQCITADDCACEKWTFDGNHLVKIKCEPVSYSGRDGTLCSVVDRKAVNAPPFPNVEKFSDEELAEASESIRVRAPDEELPLSLVSLDIYSSYEELTHIRDGARSLFASIQSRLDEEQKRNPNSVEVAALKMVQADAYHLSVAAERALESARNQ